MHISIGDIYQKLNLEFGIQKSHESSSDFRLIILRIYCSTSFDLSPIRTYTKMTFSRFLLRNQNVDFRISNFLRTLREYHMLKILGNSGVLWGFSFELPVKVIGSFHKNICRSQTVYFSLWEVKSSSLIRFILTSFLKSNLLF